MIVQILDLKILYIDHDSIFHFFLSLPLCKENGQKVILKHCYGEVIGLELLHTCLIVIYQ